jgi:hypothetical protein
VLRTSEAVARQASPNRPSAFLDESAPSLSAMKRRLKRAGQRPHSAIASYRANGEAKLRQSRGGCNAGSGLPRSGGHL